MMWIVRLALRRPLSVAVMALLMLVMGVLSFAEMNVDIFPAINLPVVMVVWSYPGLDAVDMERRLRDQSASAPIPRPSMESEHIEIGSRCSGSACSRYFPAGHGHRRPLSAQIGFPVSETILRQAPTGTTAPNIISYNAANVPVAQLNIFSETALATAAFDYGLISFACKLSRIPGFSSPGAGSAAFSAPVVVNLDPKHMVRQRAVAGGYRQRALDHQRRHPVGYGSHGQLRVRTLT